MTWPNGSIYIGDWKLGRRCGWGIFKTIDGIEYVGDWLDNARHGYGVVVHPNGEVRVVV